MASTTKNYDILFVVVLVMVGAMQSIFTTTLWLFHSFAVFLLYLLVQITLKATQDASLSFNYLFIW